MGDSLLHLTRYWVVDCNNQPTTQAPAKHRDSAEWRATKLNGVWTDRVKGVPERRPYRVVKLSPSPAPMEGRNDGE